MEGPRDEEDKISEPFSSEEDQDQDVDEEDPIARFFNAGDYQQLLTKCLSALDIKEKPPEEGATGAHKHLKNTLWRSHDYFAKGISLSSLL